jgi:hypothetical protein
MAKRYGKKGGGLNQRPFRWNGHDGWNGLDEKRKDDFGIGISPLILYKLDLLRIRLWWRLRNEVKKQQYISSGQILCL